MKKVGVFFKQCITENLTTALDTKQDLTCTDILHNLQVCGCQNAKVVYQVKVHERST